MTDGQIASGIMGVRNDEVGGTVSNLGLGATFRRFEMWVVLAFVGHGNLMVNRVSAMIAS
jgi:hypothetical protein